MNKTREDVRSRSQRDFFAPSPKELSEICQKRGLDLVGCTPSTPLVDEASRLRLWQESGYAAGMEYMKRDPGLFIDPSKFLEGCRTVLSVALRYAAELHPACEPGFGRIARYAWGEDYHHVFGERLNGLQRDLEQFGRTRSFTDAVPLLERALAEQAGLGFRGKNSLLIRPGVGSYFFIGEILLDFPIAAESRLPATASKGCSTCFRCGSRCPTGAIVRERVVDARRCISYLTIEKKGIHTAEERKMVGDWLFGCDICQDVCPFNHAAQKTGRAPDLTELSKERGSGPLIALAEIFEMSDEAFRSRFRRSPIKRAKRAGLIRNACAVSVNTGWRDSLPYLEKLLRDPDETVRISATQALGDFS